MTEPLIRAEKLSKLFPVSKSLFRGPRSFVHAVDEVSFDLVPGESLGLVGESGCGKTTIGKLLVKLLEPTEGRILFRQPQAGGPIPDDPVFSDPGTGGLGDALVAADSQNFQDLAHLRGQQVKAFRRRTQMIFQDPYESMNPRRTIFDTVAEPLAVQGLGGNLDRLERVTRLLALVGLTPPQTYLFRYPHELSGGQRQRVAIARALVIEPDFVVADEPTSMLDVSIRTGIINLMLDLAQRLGITYLYVTHDLAVARYMCQRIAVMYLGKIVEIGETEELLRNPQHPYTKALLSAVPIPDPSYHRQPANISGDITPAVDPLPRCRFYNRCPLAADICLENDHPPLEEKSSEHWTACYRV